MIEWKLAEKEKELDRKEGEWKKEKDRNNRVWEDRFEAMKKAISHEKDALFEEIEDLKSRR